MLPEETKQLITDLLHKTSFEIDEVEFALDEKSGTYWCKLSTTNAKPIIGHHGETLRALNHVIYQLLQKQDLSVNIIVDVNNYQAEKVENLKAMAHMLAERARFFKSSVDANPMSAFERRIIHEYLADVQDVKTESTGQGKDRHVVISYTA